MSNFLDKIGSVVSNPTMQGILGAAAFGANPLLGLLIGPGLKASREEQQQKVDLGRARLSGLEEELSAFRDQRARGKDRDAALVELTSRAAAANPEQSEMFGLLGRIAPDRLAQSVLGNAFPQAQKPPKEIELMRALGLEPTFANYRELAAANNPQDASGQLDAILTRLEIDEKLTAAEQAKADKAAAEQSAANNILDTLDTLSELAAANQKLSGTAGAPGSFMFEPVRQIKAAAGGVLSDMDVLPELAEKLSQDAESAGSLVKESSNLVLNRIIQMSQVPGFSQNRAVQQMVEKGTAGKEADPGTNNKILSTMLDQVLRDADQNGVEIPNRDKYVNLRRTLDGQPKQYKDEADAQRAYARGEFALGEKVIIDGVLLEAGGDAD